MPIKKRFFFRKYISITFSLMPECYKTLYNFQNFRVIKHLNRKIYCTDTEEDSSLSHTLTRCAVCLWKDSYNCISNERQGFHFFSSSDKWFILVALTSEKKQDKIGFSIPFFFYPPQSRQWLGPCLDSHFPVGWCISKGFVLGSELGSQTQCVDDKIVSTCTQCTMSLKNHNAGAWLRLPKGSDAPFKNVCYENWNTIEYITLYAPNL